VISVDYQNVTDVKYCAVGKHTGCESAVFSFSLLPRQSSSAFRWKCLIYQPTVYKI